MPEGDTFISPPISNHSLFPELKDSLQQRLDPSTVAWYKGRGRLHYILHKDQIQASAEDWKRNNAQKEAENQRLRTKRFLRQARDRVLNSYGRRCTCCGEERYEFLTIDHIHGDGAAHRRQFSNLNKLYVNILSQGCPKDKYRILCMNCNWGSRLNAQGERKCPHERERELQRVEVLA